MPTKQLNISQNKIKWAEGEGPLMFNNSGPMDLLNQMESNDLFIQEEIGKKNSHYERC